MNILPYVDEDGIDHVTKTHVCIRCGEILSVRHEPIEDYTKMVWQHHGFISYPEVLAKDEKGFTKEGVVEKPARKVLVLIPHQTQVAYCNKDKPEFKDGVCATCGKEVPTINAEFSRVDCIDASTVGEHTNYSYHLFHLNCLPPEFTRVRQYIDQYS